MAERPPLHPMDSAIGSIDGTGDGDKIDFVVTTLSVSNQSLILNSSSSQPSVASSTALTDAVPIPKTFDVEKRGPTEKAPASVPEPLTNKIALRHLFISFSDFLRLVVFTTYRQLWAIIVMANLIGLIVVIVRSAQDGLRPQLGNMATGAVSNLTAAILIRQDYIKNACFNICWSTPHTAPLWLRKKLAKVYELGGVHSSSAVAGVAWFLVFATFLTREYALGTFTDIATITLVHTLLAIFLAILIGALPPIRHAHHNLFENLHRLGGWSSIILFWPTLIFFVRAELPESSPSASTLARALTNLPAFWFLVILSLHTIYPWILLRRVPIVKATQLSDHALRLYFSPREKFPPLHGVAISTSPLREWHAFAAISPSKFENPSDDPVANSTSCVISRAGDWTSKIIASPPSHVWMRGRHQTGVLAMLRIFRSVIVVTTGSGIGPCISVFGHCPNTRVRVIWSTPTPRKIFGPGILGRLLEQDPEAVVWDTRKVGGRRPDLVGMAEEMYWREGAEAVFMISNRELTKMFVEGLGKRGVPAFAPVFDS